MTRTKTELHRTWLHTTLLISVFSVIILCVSVVAANAETLNSDSYQIQMGNLNMGAGLPSSDSYKLGVTGGQTAPGLYSSTGYIVRAGFWYLKSIIPFSFTISDLTIDFGTLTPGTPKTLTNMLSVSAGGAGGYQVTASESALLTSPAGTATIPNTTCNGNGQTCNATTAQPWTNNSKYGFGYNMSGNDVPTTFVDSTYFRPFAQAFGATVMSNPKVGRNRVGTVTYKVNISGSQAAGDYENYIIFVATPSF